MENPTAVSNLEKAVSHLKEAQGYLRLFHKAVEEAFNTMIAEAPYSKAGKYIKGTGMHHKGLAIRCVTPLLKETQGEEEQERDTLSQAIEHLHLAIAFLSHGEVNEQNGANHSDCDPSADNPHNPSDAGPNHPEDE